MFDEFEIVSPLTNIMDEMRFALCLNTGTADDLHLHTVYRVLPDERAAEAGYLRIIDESGEDYLYPAEYFILLDLPPRTTEAMFTSPIS